jgi:hypothetical protein
MSVVRALRLPISELLVDQVARAPLVQVDLSRGLLASLHELKDVGFRPGLCCCLQRCQSSDDLNPRRLTVLGKLFPRRSFLRLASKALFDALARALLLLYV